MVTNKIKALEAAKARISAKIARLEQKINAQRRKQLAGLPAKHGFDSLAAFIAAVRQAAGGRGASAGAGKKKRRRAVITDATRAEVKKLAQAGKTGGEIAKTLGISLPSVQNIKKALGLVKARK
ncbi:MAG TPA: helix-turn-helix domain-containing protein [Opitutaceae bacterium]|nr:helix-turn-helix domain-containing protein [Opitutaceae bacterium]